MIWLACTPTDGATEWKRLSLSSTALWRKVSALKKGAVALHCETLIIITLDESRTVVEDGHTIQIVSAIDWLLGKSGV